MGAMVFVADESLLIRVSRKPEVENTNSTAISRSILTHVHEDSLGKDFFFEYLILIEYVF